VQTINNARWSGSARYAEHQRHLTNALTEFTGLDPDKFSFDMFISADLGVDVQETIIKIFEYERKAAPVPLVIGRHARGKYRWTVVRHRITMQHFDATGTLQGANVSVELLEYLRR
jgi:hypothetical protein